MELFYDNQVAIILCRDQQVQAQTKHIQWKYHFIWDNLVRKEEAVVQYVSTKDMVADILTKPLVSEQHWKFVQGTYGIMATLKWE